MNLFQSSKFSSTNAYVLVKMRIITGTEALSSYELTSAALSHLKGSGGTGQFSSAFGDAFIGHVVRGGELFALLEYSAEEREDVEKLKVSVSGSYGGFSASSDLSKSIEELNKHKRVHVLYAQTGGRSGRAAVLDADGNAKSGGVVTMTPAELIGRIRDFPREALENPTQSPILWAEAFDYSVASNAPSELSGTSKLAVWWALEDLGHTMIAVDERRNTAQSVLDAKTDYEPADVEEAEAVRRYTTFLDTQLERLAQTVRTYPSSWTNLVLPALPSEMAYRAMYTEVEGKSEDTPASQLIIKCPAAWSDSQIVMRCLFRNSSYSPEPHVRSVTVLSGTSHLGGCRGDIENDYCSSHSYTISFDPSILVRDSKGRQVGKTTIDSHEGYGYVFSDAPSVTVNAIVEAEHSIFSVTVNSRSRDGFDIQLRNPLNTPDEGNHGWNDEVVVQWTAIAQPKPRK